MQAQAALMATAIKFIKSIDISDPVDVQCAHVPVATLYA
jgi:hypothetical protein